MAKIRLKLRQNGARTGRVVALEEPVARENLISTAAERLGHLGDHDRVRCFLDSGDEVELDEIELVVRNDDVVIMSFDGADYFDSRECHHSAPHRGLSHSATPHEQSMAVRHNMLTDSHLAPKPQPGAPQAAAAEASEGVSKDGRRIRFCAFVSHMKAEAAMEARFRPEKVTASRILTQAIHFKTVLFSWRRGSCRRGSSSTARCPRSSTRTT